MLSLVQVRAVLLSGFSYILIVLAAAYINWRLFIDESVH